MPYALVEDVAASWENYEPFADALADHAPPGLIVHAAGPTDEGFRIIELWESKEAWQRFASAHAAAGGEAGLDGIALVFRALRPRHVIYGRRPGRDS
jgi:hypothetical protein